MINLYGTTLHFKGRVTININGPFFIEKWIIAARSYSKRDRLITYTAITEGDSINFVIGDLESILASSQHEYERHVMHAHQDALNARQELRDSFTQYQGKGYW